MRLRRRLVSAVISSVGAGRLFARTAEERRAELVRMLGARYGNRVQGGPFAGMVLPDLAAWGDGDRAPKLLGSYEQELHPSLQRAVARAPATVINVGCAEGFYAVGLAMLLPDATVYAFDTNRRAGEVCAEAARLNGVGARVEVRGTCTAAALRELARRPGGVLAIVDCEGGEDELLDPQTVPELARCDLLVECHDFLVHGITETLQARLGATHAIERVVHAARNPNAWPDLAGLPELERWLLVCEMRLEVMSWLACWAADAGAGHSDAGRHPI